MFKELAEVLPNGVDLNFTVRNKDGELTVLVTPVGALSKVVPMSIKGSPEELDTEFAKTIGETLKTTAGVVSQVKAYEAGLKKKQAELEEKAKNKTITKKPVTAAKKDDDDSEEGLFEDDKKEETADDSK